MVIAKVISSTQDIFYDIIITPTRKFKCSCPHSFYRKVQCKHIALAKKALKGETVAGVFLQESPFTRKVR